MLAPASLPSISKINKGKSRKIKIYGREDPGKNAARKGA
jgi:hypothetical protein